MARNLFRPGHRNLVFGYHLLEPDPALRSVDDVPWQMEQLGPGGGAFDTPKAREVLRYAREVWDFSDHNVRILAEDGIRARVVSLGYHPSLELIPKLPDPPVDVLFAGSVNPRRAALFEQLQATVLFGYYGAQKQQALAQAKIHLHVHGAETALFQQPRIAHLLKNGCFVVAEAARDSPWPKVELVSVAYDELAATVRHYLDHPEERAERAARTREQFRTHYPMVEALREVVGDG